MSGISDQAFAWPIITFDFEASGLEHGTFPIEIGAARWEGPGTPIEMWSSLIKPTDEWLTSGKWMPESVKIHGIELAMLEDAPLPSQVMEDLNLICPIGTIAFCDGGGHDRRWMQRLADAAGTGPRLLIGSWGHIVNHLGDEAYDRYMAHDALHKEAHRAGPDARDNLIALAHAIGAPTPNIIAWGR